MKKIIVFILFLSLQQYDCFGQYAIGLGANHSRLKPYSTYKNYGGGFEVNLTKTTIWDDKSGYYLGVFYSNQNFKAFDIKQKMSFLGGQFGLLIPIDNGEEEKLILGFGQYMQTVLNKNFSSEVKRFSFDNGVFANLTLGFKHGWGFRVEAKFGTDSDNLTESQNIVIYKNF